MPASTRKMTAQDKIQDEFYREQYLNIRAMRINKKMRGEKAAKQLGYDISKVQAWFMTQVVLNRNFPPALKAFKSEGYKIAIASNNSFYIINHLIKMGN